MPRVTRGLGGVVFAIVLLSPLPASAGLIDFIYELSGPEFAGIPISCFFEFNDRRPPESPDYECRISEKHISGDRSMRYNATPRFRLEVGGGVYLSTGKNSDLGEFEFARVQLFAYEPMLHVRSFDRGSITVTHGAMGLSYFLVTGSGFKRFDNVGMKFVPVDFRFKRLSIAYTLRLFPNAFTAEQFGGPAATPPETGTEAVHGFMIGWRP